VLEDEFVRPGVAKLEAALAPFDARPHWGKVFDLPAERVRAAYPLRPRFGELAARCDPERRFGNEFLERYVY
jgi:xylitol oxidase